MDLARLSIRNPVLVNLLMLFLIGVGLFVYTSVIRKEVFPEVEVGVVQITTIDPGVPAADIEQTITREIESQLAGLDDIDEIQSISSEGISNIFCTLKSGVDIDRSRLDIKAEADKANLPDDVEPPTVREVTLPMSVISVGVYIRADALEDLRARTPSDQRAVDGTPFALERRLNDAADDLRDRLLRFSGVESVPIFGTRDRRLLVEVNRDSLRQHDLRIEEIERALQAANGRTPGGRIEDGGDEISLRTGTLFGEHPGGIANAARETIIRSSEETGSGLRLDRVARIVDGFDDLVERSRIRAFEPPDPDSANARIDPDAPRAPPIADRISLPAVLMSVYKTSEADAIQISDSMRRFLAGYRESLPPGLGLAIYDDRSVYIRNRLEVVETNGIIGLVIVIAVLFFFLNYRMAFMAGLGIPVSLFGAMIGLHVLGYSANMLTLFGLIIALGMVVDEGIIICENSWRYMERGWRPVPAALQGTREVFWPVVASVLTTMAAFLPLLLWSGVTGQFMSAIPVAVIIALALSLVEAMVILPAHIAEWSHDPDRRPTGFGRAMDGLFRWTDPLRLAFQRGFDGFKSFYTWVLVRSLRMRYLVIVLVTVAFFWSMSLVASGMVGTTFLDFKVVDRFYVTVQMPEGTTVQQTTDMLDRVEAELHGVLPYGSVAAVSTTVGRYRDQNRMTTLGKNVGQVAVEFHELDQYKQLTGETPAYDYRTWDRVQQMIGVIRSRLAMLPLSEYTVFAARGGPPQGSPVEVRLRGDDYDELVGLASQLRTRLERVRGLRDIESDVESGGTEYRLLINTERAISLGLTERAVAREVRAAFDGFVATTIIRTADEIDVVVRMVDSDRRTRDDVLATPVATPRGPVPLRDLLVGGDVVKATGQATVKRFDRKMSVLVVAEVEGLTAREGVIAAKEQVDDLLAGRGDIDVSFEGRFEAEQEGFGSIAFFGLVAAGLIYLILAAVLQSFMQPILVMSAVPLAFIGVLIGLFLMGEQLSVTSMVGAVALIGIVVNDSTVLVDFVNRQRREGEGRWAALVRGSRLRLRPIILTSLTTIAGLFTISYGSYFGVGGRETFLAPMGIAISWGLAFSTVLMLLIVPCLYAIYEDMLGAMGIDRTTKEADKRETMQQVDDHEARPMVDGGIDDVAPSPAGGHVILPSAVGTARREPATPVTTSFSPPTDVPSRPAAQPRRIHRADAKDDTPPDDDYTI